MKIQRSRPRPRTRKKSEAKTKHQPSQGQNQGHNFASGLKKKRSSRRNRTLFAKFRAISKKKIIYVEIVILCAHNEKLVTIGGSCGRAKSTDRNKLTGNKLTANQRFRHSDFVLISSQSEGLGKMALGIVKYF